MEEVLREWGRNIKAGREALGLKQYELARLLDVSQASLCRWETGQNCPTDAHKLRIATALHQDVRQLFPLMRASVA